MSAAPDREPLLLELGCEEIPARMLRAGAEELDRRVRGLLESAGIAHGASRLSWTPRRLTLRLEEVGEAAPRSTRTLTGPPARAAWDSEGNPTRAAEGFARKHGLGAERLTRLETSRGEYAALEVETGGETPGEVLAAGLPAALAAMPFPKLMRWGDGAHRFVRPVHWVVALHGRSLLDLQVFDVPSGRESRGHRFLGPERVVLAHPDDYVESLREAGVVVDPEERRRRIHEAAHALAAEAGGRLAEDPDLLEEVADLVEHPGVVLGEFPKRFCGLPGPILETTLRHHQKAFAVRDDVGESLPRFVAVVNTDRDPAGHVRRGNEWVVSGRLEDAEFFFHEDRKRSLEEWARELDQVTYHADLGSYAAKARRLERLAVLLGRRLGTAEAEIEAARRAALLAKADLVTGMVGEFPELQGVVGAIYAAGDGEAPAVAEAIGAHYRPQGPEDEVPPSGARALVALADRLDALVGSFGAGARPTGSRDPFGLRRAALGALRLLLENGSELDLSRALDEAAGGYGSSTDSPALPQGWEGEARSGLHGFLEERLAFLLGEEGARYDEVAAAAAATGAGLAPLDRKARVEALRGIRGDEDFLALAAAAKRIRNILTQAREKGEEPAAEPAADALAEPAERELLRAAEQTRSDAESLAAEGRYGPALRRIAALRIPVDDFFEKVLVMDPDARRRAQRLALLDRVGELLHSVIDFSQIVVEGEEAARDAAAHPGRRKNG